ncbi:MAG: glycosyltransferase family 2 protein [Deltaproteobacteria bacterium]|nr:glycosyltransferase family 2 protein [Deltaproteobacteria bacterium]
MDRPTISVTIITFNEEKNIRECLESITWADEIIVVDSFSTDRTVTICREYTEKIFQRDWPGHVRQKQFALEQASSDWILSLDADERLSLEAAAEIKRRVLQQTSSAEGYILPRHSFYLGRWINHGGWYPDAKLRLVRCGHAKWGGIDPHDKLIVFGETEQLSGEIHHYVYENIAHQLKTVDSFSTISAQQWRKEGARFSLTKLLLRPPIRFLEMYLWKGGLLDGLPGFMIAVISSYYVFLKYAKLWELQRIKQLPLPADKKRAETNRAGNF